MTSLKYTDELKRLSKKCEEFTDSVFVFTHNYFDLPNAHHKGCFIDCLDSTAMAFQKKKFLTSLISSITDYVYPDPVQKKKIKSATGSDSQRYSSLFLDAKQTFRKPRTILPTSLTKKQFENEIGPNLTPADKVIFDSLYKVNSKSNGFRLMKHNVEDAKKLKLIFKRIEFDYTQLIAQGQFSELLLYNILMNFFDAVPLVHKMLLTTNPDLERNGIDAIHVGLNTKSLTMYVGESKAYARAQGSFKAAVTDALEDVIMHHDNLYSELNLYNFSSNISEGLEKFLSDFLNGKHKDVEMNLVCMVTYSSDEASSYSNRDEFIRQTKQLIKKDCGTITDASFSGFEERHLKRTSFVLFPVKEMHELILYFQKELGIQ